MPFYIYAWIASISSAFIVLTIKFTSKHAIKNPWLFNFLWSLVSLLITLPLSILNKASLPQNWIPIIAASLFNLLFNIFYIWANYRLDVSILSPLFNFRTVFAVVLGTLFLNEALSSNQVILFLIIVIAGMFASIDEKFSVRSFFTKSIFIGLSAMLFLAVNNALIKIVLKEDTIWTGNMWMAIITQLLLIPTIPLLYEDFKKLNVPKIIPIGIIGLFQVITNFTANLAYAVNIGITSMIMATPFSLIFTIILSIFAPSILEKHTIKVYSIRLVATIVMIIGALRLTQ